MSKLSRKAIKDFLISEGIDADVYETNYFNFFRVKRAIKGTPKVTIIIPTKDRVDLLKVCIESIIKKSTFANFDIIIIDNNSEKEESRHYFDFIQRCYTNIQVIPYNEEFNYSKINNFGALKADGDHLLFLNNDVEIITPDWMESLLEHSQRPEVACVGVKLLYPNNTIQHVGVVIGLFGMAEHVYKTSSADDIGYLGQFVSIRNLSAVTSACMMIKKSCFMQLNGFDEQLKVGFGDTDICLRARESGFFNIYTPFAVLLSL